MINTSDEPLVAGIDSSTQSVKIVVCRAADGAVIRKARAAHPPGTQVAADEWWRAYQQIATDELLDGVGALAVGGQQHGLVALDESGEPVRDAVLWNDNGAAADAADLITEWGGTKPWADAVGSVPVASVTVAKLRWLQRTEPAHAARTASVLLPHDWLSWQIGGRSAEPATDRGDASGTLYFDATTNTYRDDVVRLALGHDVALPRVAKPYELVTQSPGGIAIAAGTGDNMAAALGLDLQPGEAVVSLGTSGTAYTSTQAQTHDPTGTVCGFADARGGFLPLVCTLNGARNLVQTAQLLGVTVDELSELALTAEAGAGGLVNLPYLAGERTPPLPDASGSLSGMTLDNLTPANLARACIEGVLWSLAYGVRTMQALTGNISRITLTGGAAQSRAVQAIAPAVFGLPIAVTDPYESVAVGAARQAATALAGTHEPPPWSVPYCLERDPDGADEAAAAEINQRYSAALSREYPELARGQSA